ncbi:kinase-like protein [Rostrohypoxylon terebratum]|nr:kinase-like protein [Rostrohypoxylon terebratum]
MGSTPTIQGQGLFEQQHKICPDRGNELWRENSNYPHSDQTVQTYEKQQDLYSILDNAKRSHIKHDSCTFIPLETLVLARDRRLVRDALQTLKKPIADEQIDKILERICNAGEQSFFRIFATLVLSECIPCIEGFIAEEIDDSYLPLPKLEIQGQDIVPQEGLRRRPRGKIDQRKWNAIFNGVSRNDLSVFNQHQWWVISPFIGRTELDIHHYQLERDDRLPITEKMDELMDVMDDDVRDLVRQGGFSDVSIVKLDPSHYWFPHQFYSNGEHWFALKRLRSQHRREFELEVKALRKYKDQHLLPLLATFEKDDDAGQFSMLFPRANGDLRHLWETQPTPNLNIELELWMAEQCHGLVRTLSMLHQDEIIDNRPEAHGRHGDIKAANILWFADPNTSGPDGWRLVLADFGLTTFHRAVTISAITAAKLHRTVTYQAPEFEISGAKASRKSDIWALGCTFLDFITWLVKGYEAVDQEFPTRRAEMDHFDISEDKFYVLADDRTSARLKKGVQDWISDLRENPKSTPYLKKFLNLIETEMLSIEVQNRPIASEVAGKLKTLLDGIRKERSIERLKRA